MIHCMYINKTRFFDTTWIYCMTKLYFIYKLKQMKFLVFCFWYQNHDMINKFSVYFMSFPKFCHTPRLYFVFVWSAYTLSIIPVANLWAHKITTLHDTYMRCTTYSFFRQFATKSRYMAYKYQLIASFIQTIAYFNSQRHE